MNIGDYDDVRALAQQMGDEYPRNVLQRAEIGQFSEALVGPIGITDSAWPCQDGFLHCAPADLHDPILLSLASREWTSGRSHSNAFGRNYIQRLISAWCSTVAPLSRYDLDVAASRKHVNKFSVIFMQGAS